MCRQLFRTTTDGAVKQTLIGIVRYAHGRAGEKTSATSVNFGVIREVFGGARDTGVIEVDQVFDSARKPGSLLSFAIEAFQTCAGASAWARTAATCRASRPAPWPI